MPRAEAEARGVAVLFLGSARTHRQSLLDGFLQHGPKLIRVHVLGRVGVDWRAGEGMRSLRPHAAVRELVGAVELRPGLLRDDVPEFARAAEAREERPEMGLRFHGQEVVHLHGDQLAVQPEPEGVDVLRPLPLVRKQGLNQVRPLDGDRGQGREEVAVPDPALADVGVVHAKNNVPALADSYFLFHTSLGVDLGGAPGPAAFVRLSAAVVRPAGRDELEGEDARPAALRVRADLLLCLPGVGIILLKDREGRPVGGCDGLEGHPACRVLHTE
mmetsp:Transcript_91331/g.258687  ORF Transcript_91331/g.258687 Transcript_91331/m.258687 type:complete len:273 (+) Transcript_91331:2523-3341(+)